MNGDAGARQLSGGNSAQSANKRMPPAWEDYCWPWLVGGYEPSRHQLTLPLRVAVLPFNNLDNNDSTLGLVMQDDIATVLSHLDHVNALAISSTNRSVAHGFGPRDYAKEHDVEPLFEGSHRSQPGGYQVNVRLIWTGSGYTMWQETLLIEQVKMRDGRFYNKVNTEGESTTLNAFDGNSCWRTHLREKKV